MILLITLRGKNKDQNGILYKESQETQTWKAPL